MGEGDEKSWPRRFSLCEQSLFLMIISYSNHAIMLVKIQAEMIDCIAKRWSFDSLPDARFCLAPIKTDLAINLVGNTVALM